MNQEISAVHRLRLSEADAHYGGGLIAGAKVLELFGDVATELCVRHDGDEGLLAAYSSVEFVAPLRAGDFVEVRARLIRAGKTSREMAFELVRYAGPRPEISDSAAEMVAEPEIVARAVGTCVVKADRQRPKS